MLNKFTIALILLWVGMGQLCAQEQKEEATEQKEKIVIGVKVTPPFIIKDNTTEYSGISVLLWENIADDLNLDFEYKEYDLEGLLNALEQGEVDVSINPLTVTSSRVQRVDFTQPFFITNLAIAVNQSEQNKWLAFVRNFFSFQFFKAVVLLFIVLLIFGIMVWLFERKANKEEFGPGMTGVWNGLWWSAVTMTTVGYGDKSPKTTGGRVVALVWMFTAIIIISGFTASIASALTVRKLESSIQEVRDLQNVHTVTVKASTGEEYLKRNHIDYIAVSNVQEALQMLAGGEADAVVYDEPIMKYNIKQQGLGKELVLLPFTFSRQYYSLSLPKNNPLLDRINPILLKQISGIEWKAILNQYNLDE